MAAPKDHREIVDAQAGVLLTDWLSRADARSRPTRRAGERRTLDGGERLRIVETLIEIVGGAYSHLPQKRAGYAVDPVQAMQLLRRRCTELSEAEFHLAVTGVVTELRDAHTRYIGPSPLRGEVARLPFLVEQFGPHESPTFIVSKVADQKLIDDPAFVEGVTLESWNGVPFALAVDAYATRETGGRPDARRARALESLTFRALDYGPPPDERWVDIQFHTRRGALRQTRIPWRVVGPGKAATAIGAGSRARLSLARDPAAEDVRRAKKLMFAGDVWAAERTRQPVASTKWLPTRFDDTLGARRIGGGRFGHLRIWSFDVEDDESFIREVERLVGLLPDRGLVIDLRANPGGLIWAAERLLQLFTPNKILPTRFSLLASPLTRAMASSPFNKLELEPWRTSLEDAVATGELYSQPLPLTDPEWCNDIGQKYFGPVVAVVDANTYSSGDLFAAGFVDNDIGPLLCVGEATGAGGANVWTDSDLRDALNGTSYAFSQLPDGVGFTMAIRRAVRSGESDGIPIEDLGISGIPYAMTEADLRRDNRDLMRFATDLLTNH